MLGGFIARNEIVPVAAFTSDSYRTRFTGSVAFRVAGITIPILEDSRLQEMSQGRAEGQSRDVYTEIVKRQIRALRKDFRFKGGESMNMVGDRMLAWSEEQQNRYPDDTVVAFTHGVALRCLVGVRCGWSHERIRDEVVDNAAGVRLIYDDSGLVDVRFNIDTQSQDTTTLPAPERLAA